jgi:hypothetical protein
MRIDRRSLLRTTAALVAAASLHKPALTENRRLLALLDPNLTGHERDSVRAIAGAAARLIEPDLVRQWRDGLGSEIARAAGTMAYVRWDKAVLLSGLARESGMRALQRRLDRSVFEIRITEHDFRHDRSTRSLDVQTRLTA